MGEKADFKVYTGEIFGGHKKIGIGSVRCVHLFF